MGKMITISQSELDSLIAMKLDEALKNSLGLSDSPEPLSVEAVEKEELKEEKKSESVADIRASMCA